ncbi:MAG: hypothetical protein V7637_5457 [Mycobacteriales bacterium]
MADGGRAGWLAVRARLRERRWELGVAAGREYPQWTVVGGTPLLSRPEWLPATPLPVPDIALEYRDDAGFAGVTGAEAVAARVLPERPGGGRYPRYSAAVAELAAPRLFEDRPTYRLLHADLGVAPRLVFGAGSYFDGVDVGEACAHEFAAATLDPGRPAGDLPLRRAVGDPCDPGRRRINVAVSTLTLRHDRAAGTSTFLLHRRDAAAVGHAGGMFQVLPVGIFQPSGTGPDDVRNDFSLWRGMLREFAEELLGEPEIAGRDGAPVDYDGWPLAARLTAALGTGRARAHCLGIGVDPLTLATDILTTVVIDAPSYDELFGRLASDNDEGTILPAVPFEADQIDRYARREPTQAAGAALLALAWTHRHSLLR